MSIPEDYADSDSLSDTLFYIARKMEEPFHTARRFLQYRLFSPLTPNQFDNTVTKIKEVAVRAWIVFCSITLIICATMHITVTTLFVGACSKLLKLAAIYFQKEGYTHLRGALAEKPVEKETSLFVLNMEGSPPLEHARKAGVRYWEDRLDRILSILKTEDADTIVLLNAFDFQIAEPLFAKLKEDYAHFFFHTGPNLFNKGAGNIVITKHSVDHFSHTRFQNGDLGLEILSLKKTKDHKEPLFRLLTSNFINDECDAYRRIEQVNQVMERLSQEEKAMPTFFAGNIRATQDDAASKLLFRYLNHSYRGQEKTYTNDLKAKWSSKTEKFGDKTDFISLVKREEHNKKKLPVVEKGVDLVECHLVRCFDEDTLDTKTALSPHQGIFAKVSYSK